MSLLLLTIAALAAPTGASASQVRLVQHRYGECVVGQNPREARAFLLEHVDNRWNSPTGRLIEKLSNGPCVVKASDNAGGRLRLPGDAMRHALADSLIRRELLAAPPVKVGAAVAPLMHPTVDADRIANSQTPFGGKDGQAERQRRLAVAMAVTAMSQLGECIVRRAPSEALALFRTDPNSPPESAAFAGLTPAISGCVPTGSTVELTKASLRGTIGVNYYRLANASRVTPAAPGTTR